MQQYTKYFRPEQKVQLRLLNPTNDSTEALTLYFATHGPGYFDLIFPYKNREGEEFPLTPGMEMEITTESLGIGVKMNVSFIEYGGENNIIRVKVVSDLKVFQRRTQPRVDILCGVRFTRGQGGLRSFREQWFKNIKIIEQTKVEDLPPFSQIHINLSATGLRLAIKPPVERADLFLILVQLNPKDKPVCLLCETVWAGAVRDDDGRIFCGMNIIGKTDCDHRKIESQVKHVLSL